ncbi:MAG: mechanosensitive ion channel family protein [Candidatus Izemoplasmataceae bacterium]
MQLIQEFIAEYLNEYWTSVVMKLVVIFGWFLIGILLNLFLRITFMRFLKVRGHDPRKLTIGKLVRNLIRVVVWFTIIIIILDEFNVEIAPFLASAGVLGLAIGFGAQSLVRDFLAGFFFLVENAFNEGDIVEVNGFWGTVKKMGLRATHIQSWKGIVKIVNNGDITSLENHSKAESIAVVNFGVSYDTDLDKVSEIMEPFMKEIQEKNENIVEEPIYLGVTELADSSINLRIIAKTITNTQFGVERQLRKEIVDKFREHDIEIPFPQIVVHNETN